MSAIGNVPQTSCFYFNNALVTGGNNGELRSWAGVTPNKAQKAHTGSIWQIVKGSATNFFTGGNDGLIC
jgi:hypothetical protein